MMKIRSGITAVFLLAISACQSGAGETGADTVPILAVYSDSQCLKRELGIEVIRDADALAAWWAPLSRMQLPQRQLPQELATIDFVTSAVFVVSMGSRPTPDYAVELYSDRAPVQGSSLTLPVDFLQPTPGAALAQVVTSPCAVFTVPVNHYETIAVRDSQGNNMLESQL
jgi:hypothetical protein